MRNEAMSATQNATPQGGFGVPSGEQQNWQAYYTHAQQLYDSGYHHEAEQYHAYAQQLYDAEQQQAVLPVSTPAPVNHLTAAQEPAGVQHSSSSYVPATTEVGNSQTPTWQVLYEHAQELYAAGDIESAQSYYGQAQLLYSKANPQTANPVLPSLASNSASPAQASGWNTEIGSMVPSQQSNGWAQDVNAQQLGVDSAMDQTVISSRPKRSLKKRIKIWTILTLVIGVLVCSGSYIGLFYLYKQQQNQQVEDGQYSDSIWRKVQKKTVQPMIAMLTPAFDKTIRLSLAAQPLLYELNLRSSPPESSYLGGGTPKIQTAQVMPVPNKGLASPAGVAEQVVQSEENAASTDATAIVSLKEPPVVEYSEIPDVEDTFPPEDGIIGLNVDFTVFNAAVDATPEDSATVPAPSTAEEESSASVATTVSDSQEDIAQPVLEASDNTSSPKRVRQSKSKRQRKARRARRAKKDRAKRVSSPKNSQLGNDPMSGLDF